MRLQRHWMELCPGQRGWGPTKAKAMAAAQGAWAASLVGGSGGMADEARVAAVADGARAAAKAAVEGARALVVEGA